MPAELLFEVAFWRQWPPGDGKAFLGVLGGLLTLVALGEGLRQVGLKPATTRRVVHLGVGLFVASTPLIFASPGPVYVLAVLFVGGNYVALQRAWWPGMHRARPMSLGTVTFPLALLPALAIGWSWDPDHRFALQAAFLVLAISDPLAAAVGARRSPVAELGKSWIGSMVFGSSAFLIAALTLYSWTRVGTLDASVYDMLLMGVVVAVVTTMTEALGRRGWDNFFVVLAAMTPLIVWEGRPDLRTPMMVGVGSGVLFSGLAWRLRVLSPSGALAGGLLAASLIGLGGARWVVPGFVFFILSSAFSRVGRRRKRGAAMRSEKGDVRDAGQVYANGAVAWGLLLVHTLVPHEALYWGFLGAFAAAAADTWATELGALSRRRPRLVTSGAAVPRGTSGAVSGLGTGAALAGAASVALSAWAVAPGAFHSAGTGMGVALVLGGGMAGAFVDSLAGATIQAQYHAPGGATTERPTGPVVRGSAWMTNDRVNLLCTAVGAIVAGAGYAVLGG